MDMRNRRPVDISGKLSGPGSLTYVCTWVRQLYFDRCSSSITTIPKTITRSHNHHQSSCSSFNDHKVLIQQYGVNTLSRIIYKLQSHGTGFVTFVR